MRPIIRLESHTPGIDHAVNLVAATRIDLENVSGFDFLPAQDGGYIAIHYRVGEEAWTIYTD